MKSKAGEQQTAAPNAAQLSAGNNLVMPRDLYAMRDMTALMHHGDAAIFYNQLEQDLINVEFSAQQPCFVYVSQGSERITNSLNQSYELTADTASFYSPGHNLHSDFVHSKNDLRAYLFFFDEQTIAKFLLSQDKKNHQKFGPLLQGGASFGQLFTAVHDLHQRNINSPQLLQLKLLEFLHLLALHNPSVSFTKLLSQNQQNRGKRNLHRLLQDDQLLHLNVEQLANLSGRSVSSFNRDFKAQFNTTPKQWLQQKRLQQAKSLLQNQQSSVTDIALQLGYTNVSHFIKAYKTCYGLTPKQQQKLI